MRDRQLMVYHDMHVVSDIPVSGSQRLRHVTHDEKIPQLYYYAWTFEASSIDLAWVYKNALLSRRIVTSNFVRVEPIFSSVRVPM